MSDFSFGGGGGVLPAGTMVGWQDYSDSATAITPIALSGTPAPLTNNGLGPFTNKGYGVVGHGDIWDTTANEFDWTSLKLGDTLDVRVDVTVTTSGPSRSISSILELAIGTAGPYSLNFDSRDYKNAGTYDLVRFVGLYIGDANTLTGGARITMTSDGNGDTVVVNGWYVRTLVR